MIGPVAKRIGPRPRRCGIIGEVWIGFIGRRRLITRERGLTLFSTMVRWRRRLAGMRTSFPRRGPNELVTF